MPGHTHYAEPFAGSCAVLFAKDPEGVSESINDLDGELTNLWDVLRDPGCSTEFLRQAALTPFSETEFLESRGDSGCENSVERALRFFVRNRQSRQALGQATLPRPQRGLAAGCVSKSRPGSARWMDCRRWSSDCAGSRSDAWRCRVHSSL